MVINLPQPGHHAQWIKTTEAMYQEFWYELEAANETYEPELDTCSLWHDAANHNWEPGLFDLNVEIPF